MGRSIPTTSRSWRRSVAVPTRLSCLSRKEKHVQITIYLHHPYD